MSIRPVVITLVALAALTGRSWSQPSPGPPAASPSAAPAPSRPPTARDRVEAMKRSVQASRAALHHYEWVETTTVYKKGQKKSEERQRCIYGAGGAIERTPVEDGAGATGGTSKDRGGKGAGGMKGGLATLVREAVALVRLYTPLDPLKIEDADNAGRIMVTEPDGEGKVRLVIRDYLKPGDYLTAVLDAATNRFGGVTLATYTDTARHSVTMNLAFGALPDGTLYPATIVLDIEQEELKVTVGNSGHRTPGP